MSAVPPAWYVAMPADQRTAFLAEHARNQTAAHLVMPETVPIYDTIGQMTASLYAPTAVQRWFPAMRPAALLRRAAAANPGAIAGPLSWPADASEHAGC